MNQELEQYLQFFIEHRQKDWLEWLAVVEFAVNNKVYTATKVLPFMANYGKELRMEGDIRRKESRECNRICRKTKEGRKKQRQH